MNYLTQLIEKQGTYVNINTINVNGISNYNTVTNARATVNEFDIYINGQYIDKAAYTWTPSNLSTQTITFNTGVLGYELDSDDVVIINGRWSE
jgi:archaellum component FlaF (FlaF/FlaG flagellin family)